MNWIKCITNRLLRAARPEAGIMLIEVVFAIAIFAIVSTSIIGVITSATAADGHSRQKTIALELAQQQVEYIRQLDYVDAATVGGNPAPPTGKGVLPTQSKQVMGLWYTLKTNIKWVNDPIPGSSVIPTFSNYKQVRVIVSRRSNNEELARVTTYLTNPSRENLGGLNNAIINVTTRDYGMPGMPLLGGVAINVSNATAHVDANDTTDNTPGSPTFGMVTFAHMAPTGTSDYYDVLASFPPHYVTLNEDLPTTAGSPAHFKLVASDTKPVPIYLYKPCSITVRVIDQSTGSLYSGAAPVHVTISGPSPRGTGTFTAVNGIVSINTLGGELIVPGAGYSISVYTDQPAARTGGPLQNLTVPDDYQHDVLNSTFDVTLNTIPPPTNATLTVNVRHLRNSHSSDACSTGDPLPNARVTLTSTNLTPTYTAGPRYQDSSGNPVVFSAIPFGTYNISAKSGSHTGGPTGVPVTEDSSICVALVYG